MCSWNTVLNFQPLRMDHAPCVGEPKNSDVVAGFQPSSKRVDGPTFGVGVNANLSAHDLRMLPSGMDFNSVNDQTNWGTEMVSTGLIRFEHPPSLGFFSGFTFKQVKASSLCGLHRRCPETEQHRRSSARSDEARSLARVSREERVVPRVHR